LATPSDNRYTIGAALAGSTPINNLLV